MELLVMARSSQSRKVLSLSQILAFSSPISLLLVLLALLFALHHLLLFQRKIQIWSSDSAMSRIPHSRPALVSMSDPAFQHCALRMLTSARDLKWNHPMFLLTIRYQEFDPTVVDKLQQLGVFIVETNPIFDKWLTKPVENKRIYRRMDINKFRKMDIFLNPIFRSFERLIYLDADGVLSSSLNPLIHTQLPAGSVLLMRQNDKSVGKNSLWGNEIAESVMTSKQLASFSERFPDRPKAGASCWFIVNVKMLPPPEVIFSKSIDILCKYRAAFKLNDQTLLNLLFYRKIILFPWCVWDVIPFIESSETLKQFCAKHMHLQRWIMGDLAFIFRHMSVKEKSKCASLKTLQRMENSRVGRPSPNAAKISEVNRIFPSLLRKNNTCFESFQEWKRFIV